MKWMSWLSVRQWQATLYNAHVVRFCFCSFSGLPVVVNFREVAHAMCSIANLCIIVVGDPDQK